jgi:hypothetical protein
LDYEFVIGLCGGDRFSGTQCVAGRPHMQRRFETPAAPFAAPRSDPMTTMIRRTASVAVTALAAVAAAAFATFGTPLFAGDAEALRALPGTVLTAGATTAAQAARA